MDLSSFITDTAKRKPRRFGKKPEVPSQPKSEEEQQPDFLDGVDSARLDEAIQVFDQQDEQLTKEEQLEKLSILVRNERKNDKYSRFLDEENAAPPSIDPGDIGRADMVRKLSLQCRKFIKQILLFWQEHDSQNLGSSSLLEAPESVLSEVKRDVVKLLYKLRAGTLSPDLVAGLSTIFFYIQQRDFRRANEAYLKLSIGNVPYPVGVRDVGIHARSADAKIAGDDKLSLANIMQSENMRRWIIAVKRIINFCETT